MKSPISSRQNPLFRRFSTAIKEHADEIAIEGPKQVADAVRHGWKPIEVIERGVHFTPQLFDALAETRSPQNVIGLFERPRASPRRSTPPACCCCPAARMHSARRPSGPPSERS